jgi:hypothetical protein
MTASLSHRGYIVPVGHGAMTRAARVVRNRILPDFLTRGVDVNDLELSQV